MENAEKRICRPDSHADGPSDGVMLKTDCIRTDFIGNSGQDEAVFQQRDKSEASISASVELGVFSIRDRASEIMLTVSLEDATEVVAAAFNAAKEGDSCKKEISDNAETVVSEYCS